MHSRSWILTDVEAGVHQTDFSISAGDVLGCKGSWKVSARRLQGGLSDGVDVVEIDNGRMQLSVLPTRGMGVWNAMLGDEFLGWRSPVRGPVHPKFVPLHDPNGLGWLEGFDELVVRCGLQSNGAPDFDERGQLVYPLHGRIANRPAHHVELIVDDEAETITLRGVVEETRFHFQKLRLTASLTTKFDSASFTIDDAVENYGGTPAEMQMLYHINFGPPVLSAGDQVVAPVRSVKNRDHDGPDSTNGWDVFGPPVGGQVEDCFYLDLHADESGSSQVLLKNAESTSGIVVSYNAKSLPCFSLWKNEVAEADGYVTGLEPATNYPNPRSVEKQQGRVVSLAPGETWSADVTVDRLTSADAVGAVQSSISAIVG